MSNQAKGPSRKVETFRANMRDRMKRRENGWDGARFVLVDVPLDHREAKLILPWGIRPSDPPMGSIYMVNYPKVAFPLFPYHEAIMFIHVSTRLGVGRHCCWIIVDDDPALILGREFMACPKKSGAFEFEERGDGIQASVSRRGVKVISVEAVRGREETDPGPVLDHKTFNVGGMGQFFMVNPIWMGRLREIIHESHQADVKLTLNDSEFDPISRLVNGEPRNGRIVVMDMPGNGYTMPVGLAGLNWFSNTFNMRFR